MNAKPHRLLWLGLGALIVVSLLWDRLPSSASASRLGGLPQDGFGFASRELPLNDTETQLYRQAATVKRLYQAGGQRFVLTAIDGSRNRHAVHDPLYCFRGDGWQVAGTQDFPVSGGHAKLLKLTRSGLQTEVLFWFTNGKTRQASAWQAWRQSVLRRDTLGRYGNEPVLILLQPATSETPIWSRVFARCPFLFQL